ncbi:MAG: hypothetical protein IPI67_04100 [Myxococcales bacterium]|nr:hypothetical protein [Myxococcales bacterium]
MPGVRSRFVRDLVEGFERGARPESVVEVMRRIESRLTTPNALAGLRAASHADVLETADAEELLFGLDSALGDGSGQLLESVATDALARILLQGNLSIPGDLVATVARMRAPLEHLFVALPVGFDLSKKRDGFVLFVGVGGRPRTARLLRHLAVGSVRAAQRFAREGMSETVTLTCEALGERARIEARFGPATTPGALAALAPKKPPRKPTRRPSSPHLPTTKPTLEAVDRIITRATMPPPVDPNEIVAPRSRRAAMDHGVSGPPPVPAPSVQAGGQRAGPNHVASSVPPRSDTLRSMPESGFACRGDDEEEPSESSG